jgi:hypothetical protein
MALSRGRWRTRNALGWTGIMSRAQEIANGLTATRREFVRYGRKSFAQVDAIPEDLFDEDLEWNSETGEEIHHWKPTAIGQTVQALLRDVEPA